MLTYSGEYLEEYSEEDQRNHLRDCTDTQKQKAYAKDVPPAQTK